MYCGVSMYSVWIWSVCLSVCAYMYMYMHVAKHVCAKDVRHLKSLLTSGHVTHSPKTGVHESLKQPLHSIILHGRLEILCTVILYLALVT